MENVGEIEIATTYMGNQSIRRSKSQSEVNPAVAATSSHSAAGLVDRMIQRLLARLQASRTVGKRREHAAHNVYAKPHYAVGINEATSLLPLVESPPNGTAVHRLYHVEVSAIF